ncbi:MAG: hypothetical protein A3J69_01335 [Candidatus Levybacteria bacterium RIFCSPHIGHO2_02_FULL_42_12]|nr:MAG: hypothetical protein A2698_02265 [Candidatus Levybacteria bacterium RIFCSPHIGHO2_01_FULL_42_15]OGH33901.1 MAG: hypothetical protein A3J69_01335 [Candidatus Levybacteria bacterium RIFCSPHIGHO2_02_FULL_42_12]OGH42937.1 MAG: hypothetical protein A3B53_02065 [Candidatus Levybacteria bacterium RIFCSPLOWO2_01_FULL_42_15]
MISKKDVLGELSLVIDPELNINIVDLGLIYDILIDQKKKSVEIVMTLTSPGCPLAIVFDEWVPNAAKKAAGVGEARVNLVWEPVWNPDKISENGKEELGILQ